MARLRPILFFLLVFGLPLLARPAHADGMNVVDAYNVNGALAVPGADACGGLTCVEAVSFSFTVGVIESTSVNGPTFAYYTLPGPTQFQSVGPLGQFSFSPGIPEYIHYGYGNYLPMLDQYGNEMDINFQLPTDWDTTPIVPAVAGASLFFCYEDPVCQQDFPPQMDILGVAEATVTYAPEPSSFLLLGAGLLSLALFAFGRKWLCRT